MWTSTLPVKDGTDTNSVMSQIRRLRPVTCQWVTNTSSQTLITTSVPVKEKAQSPPAQSPHANHDIPFEVQAKNSQLLLTNIENPLPSVAALSQTTSDPNLKPIPSMITEVFRCSAPDFNGDDILMVFDSQSISQGEAGSNLSLSNAIQQQPLNSKKRWKEKLKPWTSAMKESF